MSANDAAFPVIPPMDGSHSAAGYPYPEAGLTKREMFAAMAMQGALGGEAGPHLIPANLARDSVIYADALLAALEDA